MIIIRLIGGLGNQMSQYALGRRISYLNNVELKLDISAFKQYTLHAYGLHHFNIDENLATTDEVKQMTKWSINLPGKLQFLYNISDSIYPYSKRRFVRERILDNTFNPKIHDIKDNVYLSGYWGSYKYFSEIESVLRADFTIKENPDRVNTEIALQIGDTESISIHFRRGDYVTNPQMKKIYHNCSLKYYLTAVHDISKHVSQPHFFIFSDDPTWVRQNFSIPYPMTIIDHNGPEKNFEDLRLMSLCKHHIIANSSFSWWGAWLGQNPEKRVYTPKKWFNVDYYDLKDGIPESWHQIDS